MQGCASYKTASKAVRCRTGSRKTECAPSSTRPIANLSSRRHSFLGYGDRISVDCSFKGGEPGFVRLVGENMLTWPDYDGNRMYRSLGNITRSSRVGLLFISFDGTLFNGAARLRINGRAEINESDGPITDAPGAKRWVRVVADHIFTTARATSRK